MEKVINISLILIYRERLDPLELMDPVDLRVQEESLVPMVLLAPLDLL